MTSGKNMKLKYCFTLVVILIILFSLGTATASENITEISSLDDTAIIQSPVDENINGKTLESQDILNKESYSANNKVDLSITMNVKPSYENNEYNRIGSIVPWTITVKAKGGISHNTKVLEVLSINLGYVSHNTTVGSFNPENNIWEIGDLNNGKSATLTIFTKLKTAGTFTNKVYALTDCDDTNQLNNFVILKIKTGSSKITSNITETMDERNGPEHNSHERSMEDYNSRIDNNNELPNDDSTDNPEKNSKSVSKSSSNIISKTNFLSNITNSNPKNSLSDQSVKAIQAYDYIKIPMLIFLAFLILLASIIGYDRIKSRA